MDENVDSIIQLIMTFIENLIENIKSVINIFGNFDNPLSFIENVSDNVNNITNNIGTTIGYEKFSSVLLFVCICVIIGIGISRYIPNIKRKFYVLIIIIIAYILMSGGL